MGEKIGGKLCQVLESNMYSFPHNNFVIKFTVIMNVMKHLKQYTHIGSRKEGTC